MSTEIIPEDVIEALEEVRASGLTNMIEFNNVFSLMASMGFASAAVWLCDLDRTDRPHLYMRALREMGERRRQKEQA